MLGGWFDLKRSEFLEAFEPKGRITGTCCCLNDPLMLVVLSCLSRFK